MTKSELRAALVEGIQTAVTELTGQPGPAGPTEFYLGIVLLMAREFVRNAPGLTINEEWARGFGCSVASNLLIVTYAGKGDPECLAALAGAWDALANDAVDVPTKAQAPVFLN